MNVDVTFEGANDVLMQQVAKPLLDAAARAGAAPPPPPPPSVNPLDVGPGCAGKLLRWRQAALVSEVAGEMAAAARAAGEGGAKAAAAAFEANLDRVVLLGWAAVDLSTYDAFVEEVAAAPAALRPALSRLCLLYGLSRVESGMESYLAGGALPGAAARALRGKVNALCAALAADGGREARALCDGFGVPDHLLQAPIALAGWRTIQGQ
jgi:acyl-CoA oxidase